MLKGNLKLAIVQLLDQSADRLLSIGNTPSDRTSPSGSATATAIVSAWTSNPQNRTFFMDRFPGSPNPDSS